MNILVTGANRGLGLSFVVESVSRGHHVWAGVRSEGSRTEQLQALQAEHPEHINIVALDVTDEASVQAAAAQIAEADGHLDGVINNGAILVARDSDIEQLDFADVKRSFEINTFGPMLVVKHMLPLLRKGSQQSIINISSESGSFTNAYGRDFPYALSKTALNMFSTQMYKELAPQGYQVLAIHPGWMRTDMGGPNAIGTPDESAARIMDIIERKVAIDDDVVFIDIHGKAFPI